MSLDERESRLNAALWEAVRWRAGRSPWQRAVLKIVWVVGAMLILYLWVSMWDCPTCY